MHYSKDYEYSAREEDVDKNIKVILDTNKYLVDVYYKYGARLINTSYGEAREKIIDELCEELSTLEEVNSL